MYDMIIIGGGALFFVADDGLHGRELWKSDGSTAGMILVEDINPTTEAEQPFIAGRTSFRMLFLPLVAR